MAVRDGQAYLGQALACILEQTHRDLEFIVVEDGSRDATWEMLEEAASRDPRLILLRNPRNLGLTLSLNRGLERASGVYLARQDVDDISLPTRLAEQVAFMEAHPEVVLLGTAAKRIDGQGRPIPVLGRHPGGDAALRLKMLLSNAFFHASALVRLDVLRGQSLSYDPSMTYAQDYDLWSRLMVHGQAANLHEPLICFRVHGGQLSSTARPAQQECGDRTARANFARAGLDRRFSAEQIGLLRRTGLGPEELAPAERLEQLRLLLKLFELARGIWPGWDAECESVRRELLMQVRRYLFCRPRGWEMLRAQASMLALDPAGAAQGAWDWLRRGLENRLAPKE